MKAFLKAIFLPDITEPDIVMEWKLNSFYRIVTLGFCPLVIPLIFCFAFFRMWGLFSMLLVSLVFLGVSCRLAWNRKLRLSVYTTLATATGSTFLYMQHIHNIDGLYFLIFMILVAGIFLGVADAFLWALFNSTLLILVAAFLDGYSIFPRFPQHFDPHSTGLGGNVYLSTIIFLYLSSAFISILFQGYFRDLLAKIKVSQADKLLLETELLQAQKMESIGILASGIAHEFGHGLTRIKSCANLILRKNPAPNAELGKYIESINTACNDINEVSGKLLAFARKKNAEMSNLNLHDLIANIVGILKYMIEKEIAIETRLSAPHPVIRGNFPQLQSIVMNLVSNAVDSIEEKGVITFSTRMESAPEDPSLIAGTSPNRDFLVLSVSDTGSGIDEKIRDQIFKPFFTSKPPDRGTGLGLSLVARIVESHKGRIFLSTKVGEGTTFSIYLPSLLPPK